MVLKTEKNNTAAEIVCPMSAFLRLQDNSAKYAYNYEEH